jgi:PPOX class probable F420-dependent enzyme
MSQAMNGEERQAFLAVSRVGVIAVAVPDAAPLATPMWYDYQPGGLITFLTDRASRKAATIRQAGQLTLCVHADDPPYRYVSVSGPVVEIQESITEAERISFASRYLGPDGGARYVAARRASTARMIAFRVRPERWLTQDQSKQ